MNEMKPSDIILAVLAGAIKLALAAGWVLGHALCYFAEIVHWLGATLCNGAVSLVSMMEASQTTN